MKLKEKANLNKYKQKVKFISSDSLTAYKIEQ